MRNDDGEKGKKRKNQTFRRTRNRQRVYVERGEIVNLEGRGGGSADKRRWVGNTLLKKRLLDEIQSDGGSVKMWGRNGCDRSSVEDKTPRCKKREINREDVLVAKNRCRELKRAECESARA